MDEHISFYDKAVGYLRLIRPVNCLMIVVAVFTGALLAEGFNLDLVGLGLGFVTAFTFTGASMAINDYYDREIDLINAPHRPIPSGVISPREAIALCSIFTVIGFTAAYYTSVECGFLAVIAWLLFTFYSTKGKRLGFPGNLMVSLSIAIPFPYGGLTVSRNLDLGNLIFAVMAFLANTGREVTKDIVDVAGDEAQSINTIAVTRGPRFAALLSSFFYLCAVSLSFIPWTLNLLSFWYLPTVVLADIGFLYSSASLIMDHSKENARKVKNMVLLWMMLGLISFLVGSLT